MATDPNDDRKQDGTRRSASGGLFDSELAGTVRESAQQIWLPAMGAFAKAQAEGKSVFEALVKEGTSLQQKTQAVAEEHFGDVAGKMGNVATEVQAKAGEQWGKLETLFEERTAKALQKLGVPSSQDMQAMQDRIDALTAQLNEARSAPKPAKPRGTTASGRPAATRKAGDPAGKRTPTATKKRAAKRTA